MSARSARSANAAATSRARTRALGWGGQVSGIIYKDLLSELRSGEVVITSAFFALLVVTMASLAFYIGPQTAKTVGAGVIWLTIAFAAVLAVGRSWQRERQEGAFDGLLVAPLARSAIFAGKALSLLAFLFVVELVVIPVAALLLNVNLLDSGTGLLLIVLVATPGIAATGTLFGAMTVRTQARDLLLAIVMFPLLAPTLLAAVAATRELLGGAELGDLGDYFRLMGVFDVVFISGGLGLFGTLVDR